MKWASTTGPAEIKRIISTIRNERGEKKAFRAERKKAFVCKRHDSISRNPNDFTKN